MCQNNLVYAQKYFKSRVYQEWLDSLESVSEKGEKQTVNANDKELIVYIKIGSKKYRYVSKFDSSLIGQKAGYKGGFYVFDGKKAAFNLQTFKLYADAIGCQKSYKGVGFHQALPYILGGVGAITGAGIAYSLTPDYCYPVTYSALSALGGAGVGFFIGNALLRAKYARLPRDYNACLKERSKKKRNLKAMIPDKINLGIFPASNGYASTTIGFGWRL